MCDLTTRQGWLAIAEAFEKFHEAGSDTTLTKYGLCYSLLRVSKDSDETQTQMFKQLRAFNDYQVDPDNYWWPRTSQATSPRIYNSSNWKKTFRHYAAERALAAYFLAEIGDDLLS